jgi:hypothetical protein
VKRFFLLLISSSIVATGAADAAPRKTAARPAARPAAKTAPKPVAALPPVTPGIMIPRPILLSRATPADLKAHAVWSLRAALNVAALQCQYSSFLRAVDNYNQMLRKHGGELTAAQTQMIAHFTRTQKAGMAAFDRYNTRSYNSFSTLDAQYSFCWAAAQTGLALRTADVGSMTQVAETAIPQLRAALAIVPPAAGLIVPPLAPLPDFRFSDPISADG